MASRHEKCGKCRSSGGKRAKKQASSIPIFGIFFFFSTTSLPGKPIYKGFPGSRSEKKAFRQELQPPPPYAPQATCPTCQAEYVPEFVNVRAVSTCHVHPTQTSAVMASTWRSDTLRHGSKVLPLPSEVPHPASIVQNAGGLECLAET